MFTHKLYYELLLEPEWKDRRNKIIHRDKVKCQMCGKSTSELEVHHRYYLYNHNPWEYPDHALVSLCSDCHELVHKTFPPLIYLQKDNKYIRMNFTPCYRCGGRGYMKEYKNICGGVCFRCNGYKYEEIKINAKESSSDLNWVNLSQDVYDLPNLELNEEQLEKVFLKAKDYFFGMNGETFDLKKSYLLNLVASQNGYARAQNNCGVILRDDYKNYKSAIIWFMYASIQGIFQAQNHIAKFLEQGIVLIKDEVLAKKWREISNLNRHRPDNDANTVELEQQYNLMHASDEAFLHFFKDAIKKD